MSTQALFIRMLADQILGRGIRARRLARSDVGASAIEWAIISGIVVTLAIVVYVFVEDAIKAREDDIKQDP